MWQILNLLVFLKFIIFYSGLYYLEKRCITEQEHRSQYPGHKGPILNTVGCSDAWNGYVQYCLCKSGDFCNAPNLDEQQRVLNYRPSNGSVATGPG